jgi:MFS family permease
MPLSVSPARAPAARAYLTLISVQSLAFALLFSLQGLYFVQSAHLTPFQLLMVGAVLEGSAFLLEVPTGVIADVYSRRLSLVLGCLFPGLAALLIGCYPSFAVIAAAQIVSALGNTCLSGAQDAWLADELGEDRLEHMLLLGGQYGRVAGIVGILAATALSFLGLGVPILVGGACLIGLSLYLALRMPEVHFTPLHDSGHRQAMLDTLRGGVNAVRTSRMLGLLMLCALLYGASSEALDRLNEFHLLRGIGLPQTLTPALWFMLLNLSGLVVGLALIEPLRRRMEANEARGRSSPDRSRWLGLLTGLSLLAILAFAFAPGFWWAAAAWTVLGALRALYEPVYTAWINDGLESRSRATVNSLAAQADALGQVGFGPLFGLAGSLQGVSSALALAALVRLPVLVVLRLGQRRLSRLRVS